MYIYIYTFTLTIGSKSLRILGGTKKTPSNPQKKRSEVETFLMSGKAFELIRWGDTSQWCWCGRVL